MSSALRVVTAFLDQSELPDDVKQALRNALLLEYNGSSPTEFENLIESFIREHQR
jgi:hypothetical protein